MSSLAELKSTERDETLNPRQLRAAGYVPATLYGKGLEPRSLQVRAHEFQQLFTQGVRQFQLTGFISCTVKAQDVQRNPVSQQPLSIQFMPLEGANVAPAAKQSTAKAEASEPVSETAQPSAETAAEETTETVLTGA